MNIERCNIYHVEFVFSILFISVVCEEPLGMDVNNPLIPDEGLQPSSIAEDLGPESIRLNSPEAWSPLPTDEEPFIVVDFDEPTPVTGVVIKGSGPDAEDFPTEFTIEYSPDGVNFYPLKLNEDDLEPLVRSSTLCLYKYKIYLCLVIQ